MAFVRGVTEKRLSGVDYDVSSILFVLGLRTAKGGYFLPKALFQGDSFWFKGRGTSHNILSRTRHQTLKQF